MPLRGQIWPKFPRTSTFWPNLPRGMIMLQVIRPNFIMRVNIQLLIVNLFLRCKIYSGTDSSNFPSINSRRRPASCGVAAPSCLQPSASPNTEHAHSRQVLGFHYVFALAVGCVSARAGNKNWSHKDISCNLLSIFENHGRCLSVVSEQKAPTRPHEVHSEGGRAGKGHVDIFEWNKPLEESYNYRLSGV